MRLNSNTSPSNPGKVGYIEGIRVAFAKHFDFAQCDRHAEGHVERSRNMLRWVPVHVCLLFIISCINKDKQDYYKDHFEVHDTLSLEDVLASPNKTVISYQKTIKPNYSNPEPVNFLGIVLPDERRNNSVSARVEGRIEKLYVKYPYQHINKGTKILDLYSPTLSKIQEELLFLMRNKAEAGLIKASEEKLKLRGFSEEQLNKLKLNNEISPTISIYSPYSGYIVFDEENNDKNESSEEKSLMEMNSEINVSKDLNKPTVNHIIREGSYISEGQTLFNINDLETVWIIFSVENSYFNLLSKGDSIKVFNNRDTFFTQIDFIRPMLNEGQNFLQVRSFLPNVKHKFKINSQVKGVFNSPKSKVITIPYSSVFFTGTKAYVWLVIGKTDEGKTIFKVTEVTTGNVYNNIIEIKEGINPEDEIAEKAGFMTDRESFVSVRESKQPVNPVSHSMHQRKNPNAIMLSAYQQKLANIQTDIVKTKSIWETIDITGIAIPNQRNLSVISSRVNGRIEKLHVKNPETYIQKGQAIYDLYSEELISDLKDYLLFHQQLRRATYNKEALQLLVSAARKKLELWTLSPEQIKRIEKTQEIPDFVTFYSPESGYLSELIIQEGIYIETGTPLFSIVNLSTVWVDAQIYSNEIPLFSEAIEFEIRFDALPGKTFTGHIVFDNPKSERSGNINFLKLQIDNKQEEIKPGMLAYVSAKTKEKNGIVIPKSALLHEKMPVVWIQTEPGMFESRMVQTGIENKDEVEIISGITEGNMIVTSGAYLLNSEFVLKKGGAMIHQH